MSTETQTNSLRIIFMGTPDFAVAPLKKLVAAGHKVICVYTQPPRPKGRGQHVQPSPVHEAAIAAGIEVRHPTNFKKDEDVAAFMALEADVAVVAAYGLILPKAILDAPKYGCINIHASLLPRWRGASPIHRAILEGDAESGVTIMQMDVGLDTGPMIAKKAVPIRAATTAQSLHDILSALGAAMIDEVMCELAQKGSLSSKIQPEEGATYAALLTKQDGRIDWDERAEKIDRQIRALNPWPGTWCETAQQKRLKILEAALVDDTGDSDAMSKDAASGTILKNGLVVCGGGTVLQLVSVQPENKKPMAVREVLNGGYLKVGDILA